MDELVKQTGLLYLFVAYRNTLTLYFIIVFQPLISVSIQRKCLFCSFVKLFLCLIVLEIPASGIRILRTNAISDSAVCWISI